MLVANFHHNAIADLPAWAKNLHFPYFMIRIEGRNKTKRRKYYRQIQKEKLRLVESGIPIQQIDAVCRYLVRHRQSAADKMKIALSEPIRQMTLPF